ncbi:MAG: TatD family deoxyribonuclease [Ignavibacteria bacterium]|nr:TatD family deoxyribonuclease [Ignavibacteria bacterium]
MIDTHCHLYYKDFKDDIEEVIDRALNAGIEKMIIPSVDSETIEQSLKISEKFNSIYIAIGFHPSDIKNLNISEINILEQYINYDKVVAIGEIGLDYYWDSSYSEKQKEFFKIQLDTAVKHDLPVIIHTRKSISDAFRILSGKEYKDLKAQFHCFSGDTNDLQTILSNKNFFISFCGNLTYKNFRQATLIPGIPVNKLLTETDSPFLPPAPFFRKRNEPSYLTYTAKRLSEILSLEYSEFEKTTTQNAEALFYKLNKK